MKLLRNMLAAIAGVVMIGLALGQPATAQESTWDAIQTRGSLRIGATQAPPWYFKDPSTNEWSGLGVSVGKAMAETLDVEIEVVEVTWGTAVAALQADKIDVMFVLDATPGRAMAVDFPAQPLLHYALAVLARDDLEVSAWEDLNNSDITVAVTQGTTMDAFVTNRLQQAEILRFPTNGESVAAFQAGRADAVSLFHPPLIAMQKRIGRGQIVVPTPVRPSSSSAAVRREADKTWRDWVNTAISFYYNTNQTQVWYEDFLRDFGMDPSAVPAIRKELWPG